MLPFGGEPKETWRTRYCQNVMCGRMQVLYHDQEATMCRHCGGIIFKNQPPPHVFKKFYELTPWDRTFLRCQRIDPEED